MRYFVSAILAVLWLSLSVLLPPADALSLPSEIIGMDASEFSNVHGYQLREEEEAADVAELSKRMGFSTLEKRRGGGGGGGRGGGGSSGGGGHAGGGSSGGSHGSSSGGGSRSGSSSLVSFFFPFFY